MVKSAKIFPEQLDYEFLLLAYLICADKQIHSKEITFINELEKKKQLEKSTIEEKEKIFTQKSNLTLIDIAQKILPHRQKQVFYKMLELAKVDGYFDPSEQEMIGEITKLWNWDNLNINQIHQEAEYFNARQIKDTIDKINQPSFIESVGKNVKKVFSNILNIAKPVATEEIKEQIEIVQQRILLSGTEYDNAIRQCAVITIEDYKFTEKSLKNTESALRTLESNLQKVIGDIQVKIKAQGKATAVQEVTELFEDTKNSLINQIFKEISEVRNALDAKQRALNYFSIAFVGKTKVGKSTLHATITGEDWNSIGIGKQRTTRFNRVYEWKNIRIIDTPGIGAAENDGRKDEEIAKSIIDESDVICYVVTDDSIQNTELGWMRLLKENNKPLIVLLNIKEAIDRDSRRLERFLKKHKELFEIKGKGKNGIDGHINRIRKDCNQHYGNNYFDIIPVMLLAAQISQNPQTEQHQKYQKELFQASRIQNFLNSIRVSILENGDIRRSQNILGSTVGKIEKPKIWITNQKQVYRDFKNNIETQKKEFNRKIKNAKEDSQNLLKKEIEEVYKEVFEVVGSFAEENWNTDEATMKIKWDRKCEDIYLQQRLANSISIAQNKFNELSKDILEEIGRELQLIAELNMDNFKFSFAKQDINIFFRKILKLGSIVLKIGAVVTSIIPPISWGFRIAGWALSWVGNLFKSKEEKKKKAIENISHSLTKQIEEQKKYITNEYLNTFKNYCNSIDSITNDFFKMIIESLDLISSQLIQTEEKLNSEVIVMNHAYAKRIVDWYLEKRQPLTEDNINITIKKVERNFGYNINIQTGSKLPINESRLNKIKKILQEDIYFI